MSNVESIIIEHLKAIRNDLGGLKQGVADLTLRVGSVEQSVAGLRKDIAQLHGDMAITHQRIDHLDIHVERIERRLEIVSA